MGGRFEQKSPWALRPPPCGSRAFQPCQPCTGRKGHHTLPRSSAVAPRTSGCSHRACVTHGSTSRLAGGDEIAYVHSCIENATIARPCDMRAACVPHACHSACKKANKKPPGQCPMARAIAGPSPGHMRATCARHACHMRATRVLAGLVFCFVLMDVCHPRICPKTVWRVECSFVKLVGWSVG